MSIYFKPTWLYIKQHNTTGLKYLGKTTCPDPIAYTGSGIYWRYHLKKHGKDVSTVWTKLFENETELTSFAIAISKWLDIVNSDEWANLILENGRDGGIFGKEPANKGKKASIATCLKMKGREPWNKGKKGVQEAWNKGKTGCYLQSSESNRKRSNSLKGRKKPPRSPEHCRNISEGKKRQKAS